VDISERFVALAREGTPPGATFDLADARCLSYEAEFDAVIALCQGAFGLSLEAGEDEQILAGMARAVRPGGRVALSAFSAYFAVRYHSEAEFDADAGLAHEVTDVRDEAGAIARMDLWTGCYTPRELRLLARACGLVVERVSSVEPGAYGDDRSTIERPELLMVARRPT
jgi:SAM-dependent methyltransferase